MSPDGGAGWDEPPLDIQVPDDARELERDVLAYHRELRAKRRRRRLRRLASPFAGQGTIMPLLASILAVCLVAGAMLSVATFSPSTAPAERHHQPPTATAPGPRSASGSPSVSGSPSASSARRASAGSTVGASGSASARTRGPTSSARAASPSARSNPSSTASRVRPPGGP